MSNEQPLDLLVEGKCIPNMNHNDLDDMTMRLFMNKTNYNRYIEKTDPKEHEERKKYQEKLKKYEGKIIELTKQKLYQPTLQITTNIDTVFEQFMRTCINHFEMKEIENKNKYNDNDNEDDDDGLFVNMDSDNNDNDNLDNKDSDNDSDNFDVHLPLMVDNFSQPIMKSFWGKSIQKNKIPSNTNAHKFFSKRK